MSTLFGETEIDAEVPVRIRGWEVVEGQVLIVAMNLTAPSVDELHRIKQVNTLVTSGYAQTVFYHDSGRINGKIPSRLRIAEVNNTDSSPKTLYVNTSLARDYYLGDISGPEFTEQYWDTESNMTSSQEQFVREMDRAAGNVTLHNRSAK
ncbi:hypothetical protein [Halosimplex sp. J119]